MNLYGYAYSACTKTVLMMLAESGIEAEFRDVDLAKGAHKSPEHLELHPFGRVPVLEDGEFRLFESRAIVRYLDRLSRRGKLTPSEPRQAALMEQWISVDASYFTPAAYSIVVQKVYAPMMGGVTDEDEVSRATSQVKEVYSAMDHQLSRTPYLVGEEFTLADLCFIQYTDAVVGALGEAVFEGAPYTKVWRETVVHRPSFEAALKPAHQAMAA